MSGNQSMYLSYFFLLLLFFFFHHSKLFLLYFSSAQINDLMYFYMKFKNNSVWYNFYQGTSVSITFYIFEHYQLWMMDSKAQRVFFPKTTKIVCVAH